MYIQQKYIEAYGFDSMYITLKKMFGVVLNNLVTTRVFNVHLVLEYMWNVRSLNYLRDSLMYCQSLV